MCLCSATLCWMESFNRSQLTFLFLSWWIGFPVLCESVQMLISQWHSPGICEHSEILMLRRSSSIMVISLLITIGSQLNPNKWIRIIVGPWSSWWGTSLGWLPSATSPTCTARTWPSSGRPICSGETSSSVKTVSQAFLNETLSHQSCFPGLLIILTLWALVWKNIWEYFWSTQQILIER